MNCSTLCRQRAKERFSQCYGRLLLLGLCLSFPPACLNTALQLFGSHIQSVGDRKKWLMRIVLPWFKSLRFQPETVFILSVSCLSFILLDIFVLSVFSVGIRRYILISQKGGDESMAQTLFWGFDRKSYGNIVKTMFLRDLYIAGWSLLLLFPGIVKSFEYLAVPWLLAEHPEKPAFKTFRRGKLIMRRKKTDAFLTLYFSSLILWGFLNALLSTLVFSIPGTGPGAVFPMIMRQASAALFVFPYRLLTEGEFYYLAVHPREMRELLKSLEEEEEETAT